MRRAIAKSLILFILIANFAWAGDTDELRAADGANKVVISMDNTAGHDSSGHHDTRKNSPCCHGSAHYVGLPPVALTPFQNVHGAVEPVRVAAVYSLDKEPPLPPPNI